MNYKNYRLSNREWIIVVAKYLVMVIAISYLFYDSVVFAIISVPFFYLFLVREKAKRKRIITDRLDEEFIIAIQSVSTAMVAGLSAENAFIEAHRDFERMNGKKSVIVKELAQINKQVENGTRLEDTLMNFAHRTENNNIEDFAICFGVAKKSGGSFSKIIAGCTELMKNQRQIEDEARVLIRGKQYEQRIMSIIPIGIIVYLRYSSENMMSVLYHNVLGVIVMTICLILYISSIYISERMCDIKI